MIHFFLLMGQSATGGATMESDRSTVLDGLIDRIRSGDQAAIGELVSTAQNRMRGLAAKILNQDFPGVKRRQAWNTAELLQELSCRILEVLKTVPPNDAKHFMRLVAQHVRWHLGDVVRSPQFEAHDALSDLPQGDLSSSEVSTAKSFAPRPAEVAARLQMILASMPQKFEAVVDLKLVWGLTHDEIATQLDVSQKAVQRYWHEAIAICRDGLIETFPCLDQSAGGT